MALVKLFADSPRKLTDTGQCAMCGQEMRNGVHYAEFAILSLGAYVMPGLATCLLSPSSGRPGHTTPNAWMLDSRNGQLCHEGKGTDWSGQPQALNAGDCVGLLLDLDAGSLAVYVNGAKHGVIASGLKGPLFWAVDLMGSASVQIDGPKPPPI